MTRPPVLEWPPLIKKGGVPRFVRVRDIVLTTMAWLLLGCFMGEPFYYLYDYIAYPHFAYSRTTGPDWAALWLHLESFIYLALFLVLWLVVWGFARRRILRRVKDSEEPLPLSLEDLLARRRISPAQLSQLREEKIVVVNFDDEHRITSAVAKPTAFHALVRP